jgi:transposase InsO family protein
MKTKKRRSFSGEMRSRIALEAIYPKPRLSAPVPGHRIQPYLLRDVVIDRPDQCWSSDITSIRLRKGLESPAPGMDRVRDMEP